MCDLALGLFTRAIRACPEEECEMLSKCYSNRANCFIRLNKFNDAITDCREAIRLNGDNLEAYLRYGSASYNLNRRNEAAIYFSCGLRINRAHQQLYHWHDQCKSELSAASSPSARPEYPGRWLRTRYTVVNDRIRRRIRPYFAIKHVIVFFPYTVVNERTL